jgi:cytochrome c-type biogenesis protein
MSQAGPVPTVRSSRRVPARGTVAAGITAAVLAAALAAGILASVTSGPLVFVESVSAFISGMVLRLGTQAPLGYAVVAGMVAAVNPCGFVLLPAYLGLYVGDARAAGGPGRRAVRAVTISLTMTGSFVALFGVAGFVAGLAASAVTSALPWIGTATGAGLVLLGGIVASGREVGSSLGPRAASRFRAAAAAGGIGGYAAYGAAYALASLGCTLPVFLGVVATSFQLHGVVAAASQFMLFGLGMGIVLTILTAISAIVGPGFSRRFRAAARNTGWVTAVLLWLAGTYLIAYWLTAIRLL